MIARRLALWILYGSGAVMFALMLPVRWTALSALLIVLPLAATVALLIRRGEDRHGLTPHVLDIATVVMIISYAAYATITSPWEWDFWTDWGLKARVFFEHRGIDWAWLESPFHELAHPDYPPLVPLNYAFVALLRGAWSDRWLGVFFVAWAMAVLLIVRSFTSEETASWISAAATFAVAPVAMTSYIGLAEGPFIALSGASLLFLRRALRLDDSGDWHHGALLLGLAANCKNEGLALIASAAIGVMAINWRRALRLWPSIALAAPWLMMRAAHALPTDIARGGVLERVTQRMSSPFAVLTALDELLADRWLWIAILATLMIVPRAISRERFIVTTTAVQLAIYVAVYFATPNETAMHIATSWDRLTRQVQLPITVVCVLLLAEMLIPDVKSPA